MTSRRASGPGCQMMTLRRACQSGSAIPPRGPRGGHTSSSMVDVDARGRKIVKYQKNDEDDGARLDPARALRLRQPGGLHSSKEARLVAVLEVVAIRLLVGVAGDVLGRQRDRCSPHEGRCGAQLQPARSSSSAKRRTRCGVWFGGGEAEVPRTQAQAPKGRAKVEG